MFGDENIIELKVDDESFMALNLNGSQNKLNGVIEYDKALGI